MGQPRLLERCSARHERTLLEDDNDMGPRIVGSCFLLLNIIACSGGDELSLAGDIQSGPGLTPLSLPQPGDSLPPPPGSPPTAFTQALSFRPPAFVVSSSLLYYMKRGADGFASSVHKRNLSTNATLQLWSDDHNRAGGLAVLGDEVFFAVGCSVMHVSVDGGQTYTFNYSPPPSACHP